MHGKINIMCVNTLHCCLFLKSLLKFAVLLQYYADSVVKYVN